MGFFCKAKMIRSQWERESVDVFLLVTNCVQVYCVCLREISCGILVLIRDLRIERSDLAIIWVGMFNLVFGRYFDSVGDWKVRWLRMFVRSVRLFVIWLDGLLWRTPCHEFTVRSYVSYVSTCHSMLYLVSLFSLDLLPALKFTTHPVPIVGADSILESLESLESQWVRLEVRG